MSVTTKKNKISLLILPLLYINSRSKKWVSYDEQYIVDWNRDNPVLCHDWFIILLSYRCRFTVIRQSHDIHMKNYMLWMPKVWCKSYDDRTTIVRQSHVVRETIVYENITLRVSYEISHGIKIAWLYIGYILFLSSLSTMTIARLSCCMTIASEYSHYDRSWQVTCHKILYLPCPESI